MKKTLSLLLSALLLTGTLAASAGAEDPKTTISLTKEAPAPLAYEIVVPETAAVTGAGETSIGAATVENVENAAENTVISYTAVGTDFTADDGSGTIPADYFLDAVASTPLAGETVKVYESGAIVTNPPEIYVSITESDWESAAAGTYTATVTYTFDDYIVVEPDYYTVSALLFGAMGSDPWSCSNDGGRWLAYGYHGYWGDNTLYYEGDIAGTLFHINVDDDIDLTFVNERTYTCYIDGASDNSDMGSSYTLTFYLIDGVLARIDIESRAGTFTYIH